jgi:hypothetical protein
VTLLQAWLVIGLPTLVAGLALFLGRSRRQALFGYLILIGGFAGMAVTHRPSAVVFGGLLALLYAAGRGGEAEGVERGHGDEFGIPPETYDPGHGHIGASGTAGTADQR